MPQAQRSGFNGKFTPVDVAPTHAMHAADLAALKAGTAHLEDRGADGVWFVQPLVQIPTPVYNERGFLEAGPLTGGDRSEKRLDARGAPHEKAWYAPYLPKK